MLEQANELINSGNSREQAEGYGMLKVINKIKEITKMDPDDYTDGEVLDIIYEQILK